MFKSQGAPTGVDGKKLGSPGHYVLDHVELYPHNWDKHMEIKEIVSTIEISESVTQSSILVKLFISDSGNILETLRISGNEKIHIHLYQDILEPAVKKEMDIEVYISDILDYSKPTVGAQAFEIQAVSKEALYSELTTLNEHFKGSVTDLVPKICQSFLKYEGKVAKKEDSGGGGVMQGIWPNLKPFKAIKWLIKNGISDGSQYYFWDSLRTNNEGINKTEFQLYSYKEIIQQDTIGTFNNVPFFKEKERTIKTFYKSQLEKIKKISSSLKASVFNDIGKGAYASKTITVDLSKKTCVEESFSYEDKMNEEERSNKFQPFNKQVFPDQTLFESPDSRKIYISANANAFGPEEKNYHAQLQENIKEANCYKVNARSTSQRVILTGNPDLHAGGMVELNLIKAISHEMLEGEKTPYDEYMSGKYMIESLIHKFDGAEYQTIIEVIKDSSKVDLESMVKL